jgi:hypothetical protein
LSDIAPSDRCIIIDHKNIKTLDIILKILSPVLLPILFSFLNKKSRREGEGLI